MSKRFDGKIDIDGRDSAADWDPYVQPVAPDGAPNVLNIVLDDVGFSAMEPWGGLIETPNINKLAEGGLTYTNWHAALCWQLLARGRGPNVGKDPASPVTDDYAGATPYAFTGGTIKQAVVDVSGEQYVDLETEALAMMKRE